LIGGPGGPSIGASVPLTAAGEVFPGGVDGRDIHHAPAARRVTNPMAITAIDRVSV